MLGVSSTDSSLPSLSNTGTNRSSHCTPTLLNVARNFMVDARDGDGRPARARRARRASSGRRRRQRRARARERRGGSRRSAAHVGMEARRSAPRAKHTRLVFASLGSRSDRRVAARLTRQSWRETDAAFEMSAGLPDVPSEASRVPSVTAREARRETAAMEARGGCRVFARGRAVGRGGIERCRSRRADGRRVATSRCGRRISSGRMGDSRTRTTRALRRGEARCTGCIARSRRLEKENAGNARAGPANPIRARRNQRSTARRRSSRRRVPTQGSRAQALRGARPRPRGISPPRLRRQQRRRRRRRGGRDTREGFPRASSPCARRSPLRSPGDGRPEPLPQPRGRRGVRKRSARCSRDANSPRRRRRRRGASPARRPSAGPDGRSRRTRSLRGSPAGRRATGSRNAPAARGGFARLAEREADARRRSPSNLCCATRAGRSGSTPQAGYRRRRARDDGSPTSSREERADRGGAEAAARPEPPDLQQCIDGVAAATTGDGRSTCREEVRALRSAGRAPRRFGRRRDVDPDEDEMLAAMEAEEDDFDAAEARAAAAAAPRRRRGASNPRPSERRGGGASGALRRDTSRRDDAETAR